MLHALKPLPRWNLSNYNVGIIIPILKMRKWRFREAKGHLHSNIAN